MRLHMLYILQCMNDVMRIDNLGLQGMIQAKTGSVHTPQPKAGQAAADERNFYRIEITPESERKEATESLSTYAPNTELKPIEIRAFLFDPSVKRAGDYAIIHSPMDKWLDQDKGYMAAQIRKTIQTLMPSERVFQMSVSNGIQKRQE